MRLHVFAFPMRTPLLMAFAAFGLLVSGVSASETKIDFARDIRPVLSKNCFACHGPSENDRQGGLRLDVQESAHSELDSGAHGVVPGKPEQSEVIARITSSDPDMRMPPADSGHTLKPEEIERIRQWISEGGKYSEHWSFVKPVRPELPAIKDTAWPKNGIDHFILARLEAAGLKPEEEADRYQLIRRLSLDLRGLPPTIEETDIFVRDDSPGAYERLVERMLADPAYGERWARLWLDLARYADSMGYGSDPLRTIWRYRDWTIDAFNSNMPFDQFTIEQLAGDLLPNPSTRNLMATAFHRNSMTNVEGGTDDEEFRTAAVLDRVDTTMQVWMGLTMRCAQCHDHKFDPISQKDYYQAYAFFNQTADADLPSEAPTIKVPTDEMKQEIAAVDAQIAEVWKKVETPELAEAQKKWESQFAEPAQWSIIDPVEIRAVSGVPIKRQPDGSFLVTDTIMSPETYIIRAKPNLKGITAFRLEALPHEMLPTGGAGRGGDGNFILTDFRARLKPAPGAVPPARFVRVELSGEKRILSLAEVEVLSDGKNIAKGAKASHSSSYLGAEADRAVDGVTDGDASKGSITHTNEGSNPWWEADLGGEFSIDDVVLWNRTDNALQSRLANAKLVLLDGDRKPVYEAVVATAPNPSSKLGINNEREIEFSGAEADYAADKSPVTNAVKIKGKKPAGGWNVSPLQTKPHAAVFFTEQPVDASGEAELTIDVDHQFAFFGFALGSFRLSVTNSEVAAKRGSMPPDVTAALDVSADKRNPQQLERIKSYFRSIAPELEATRKEVAELEKKKPVPPTLPIMRELPEDRRRETHLLVKGSFLSPGEVVQPEWPSAFHAASPDTPKTRLGFARWLVNRDNPLTARVAVNRYWSQLFGRGLVSTEGDFGNQGEPPTHPELLDWLAVEFMDQNWDMKQLLRTLVTSAAYRQSSQVTAEKLEKDPRNELYSRGPRFRLEAEMVRDQALALSGLLSRKMHGPSVFPPQPPGMWRAAFNASDNWNESKGEDRYRRALYVFWRRTVPYPSMATFDAPSREICTVKRERTNTPLQAFVTLNDPVYVEIAQALARRAIQQGGATDEERVTFALRLCLGEPPSDLQKKTILSLLHDERERYSKDAEAAKKLATEPLGALPAGVEASEAAAWTVVANVLLNMDAVLTKG